MTRALFVLFVFVPGIALAQQGAASPLDGVWKISEIVTTGANPSTIKSPQPSLVIFARGHYSWLNVNGTTARKQRPALATPGKFTDAEKVAAFDEWQPFTANSGTFEAKGSTLTRTPIVAKNVGPSAPGAKPIVQEFKIDGNTLTLSGPAAGQNNQTRFTLTRVR